MLHTKFGQDWLSREDDVNGRRKTDGLQPIAIGLQSQVTYEVHHFDVWNAWLSLYKSSDICMDTVTDHLAL